MHAQVRDFVQRLGARWRLAGAGVEFGAYDVNGSARAELPLVTSWVGVDWRPGPGVDVVALAHEYAGPAVDVALSTEMLEHDPHWPASLQGMAAAVQPGGCVMVTCAGPERPAHEVWCAPGNHYAGRSVIEIAAELQAAAGWARIHAEAHTLPADSYVAASGRLPLDAHPPLLSVIIPAVGNVALTARCIDSVRALALGQPEIILVDNGSMPAHREALAELGADVFLSYDKLIGYPAAINRGAALAQGEYLCLLNNDTELQTAGWDAQLIATCDATGAAIVSPVTDVIANPVQRAFAADSRQPFEAPELFFVCVLLRRATFAEHGGLDERFGLGNCEDRAFCRKVKQAGGRLVIEPGVFVRHVGHGTFGRLPGQMFAALLHKNELLLAAADSA